jgi:hypothetical protein
LAFFAWLIALPHSLSRPYAKPVGVAVVAPLYR